jgi:tRNA uridine 5-carbamoylmethylation protein Kti12
MASTISRASDISYTVKQRPCRHPVALYVLIDCLYPSSTSNIPEVHVGTPADKCREINKQLLADKEKDGGYEEEDFENLIFRYEEPNGMTRWDSPLFTVLDEDETPPIEQIWEAMVGSDGKAKVVRPNQATVLVRKPSVCFVHALMIA